MSGFFDKRPYPFADPVGKELRMVLCQIHPDKRDAVDVMESVPGLSATRIHPDQAVYFVWREILVYATRQGKLRALVQVVYDGLDSEDPMRGFLGALLQDQTPPVSGELRKSDGTPIFITGTDVVLKEEAFLYRDDLTVEIGMVPGLIETLGTLFKLSPAICKFSVDFNGVGRKTGTGFRIGPDLLLTNWHVLHLDNDTAASQVDAEFLFEKDSQGKLAATRIIGCKVDSIRTHRGDDWAVIQTSAPMDDAWPIIPMCDGVKVQQNDRAYIIQHPGGERKRLGFVRNQVSLVDDRVIHYLTDTKEGSSGAPVFNQEGKLFALHHAGGTPQQIVGRPPVRKNEGIRISRVIAGLKAQGVLLAAGDCP
jgi:V8-like Glu-specific endopeptidase